MRSSIPEHCRSEANQKRHLPMPAIACEELIAEVEGAVQGGSMARRARMLQQITGLFLAEAARLSEQQIGIFDEVIVRLVDQLEPRTLVHLSKMLADVPSAPREATRRLAWHEDASVAAPVLRNCKRSPSMIFSRSRPIAASSTSSPSRTGKRWAKPLPTFCWRALTRMSAGRLQAIPAHGFPIWAIRRWPPARNVMTPSRILWHCGPTRRPRFSAYFSPTSRRRCGPGL